MQVALLVGVVAVLGIASVYFWVVRRGAHEQTSAAGPDQK
jgi:hypothetical protein